jgi:hypothetical protein
MLDYYSSDYIRKFKEAEHHFLEVLITDFELSKRGQGSELKVKFDNNTPTIWTRFGQNAAQQLVPDFDRKAANFQSQLDSFLFKPEEKPLIINEKDSFPFRYASGGTLPVLRIGNKEYYSLFYRSIFPIGWNIANGGCDNRFELLNPPDTIERELREELMIVDATNKRRYVFAGDEDKPFDHPSFAAARRFWEVNPKLKGLPDFEETPILLKWLKGPDCLTVQHGDNKARTIEGCFLNINAEDFGIELDKVAVIHLDEDAILLDGEIIGNTLQNTVVGLFEVDRLSRELKEDKGEYFPNYFFYNAEKCQIEKFQEKILESFNNIKYLRPEREITDYTTSEKKFDLCPVTKRIVKRYFSLPTDPTPTNCNFDVFISYGSEDVLLAKKVFEFLEDKKYNSFLSSESNTNPDFSRAINDALDSAKCLVAVGTKPEYLKKKWVEYEYGAFHNDMMSGRKKVAKLLSFISLFDRLDLPLPLRKYQSVEFNENKIDDGLKELIKFISGLR